MYDLEGPKNEGEKIISTCKTEGCQFRTYGSWNSNKNKFILKSLKLEHNCSRALENKQATSY